ncbi:signal peptide peptidase SppA [Entomospira entomophila]|uniref:Signal peptide peptidase SppA n=1 Tax=Entomospira entomophila TaxID=2719988 RepID=A0A968G7M6_9SPIO|nr:signal peptide peptidase SppA [Entomospira entomophilus]NIZ40100.1 signal peptide peptidase SppA [Entomospira entomophilus]WDI35660.1 signal peptide peptidase SppA [Entomospira entomophilus]
MKNFKYVRIIHHFILTIRQALSNIIFVIALVLLAIFSQYVIALLRYERPSLPRQFVVYLDPQHVYESINPNTIPANILQTNQRPHALSGHQIRTMIHQAAEDKRVSALWMDLSSFQPSGWAVVEEVYGALAVFKESGKPIYAFSPYYNKPSYFLASIANEIWMDPMGALEINGFASSEIFISDALKNLGIEANILKVGRYKSATESLERNTRSDSNTEMTQSFLSSIWDYYATTASTGRNNQLESSVEIFTPEIRKSLITNPTVRHAKELNIIDRVGNLHEALATTLPNLRFDAFGQVIDSNGIINYLDYTFDLTQQNKQLPLTNMLTSQTKPTVAVIYASGSIVDGYAPWGTIGSASLIGKIQQAVNDQVDAIVLRLDTPGGSSFASEQIYRTLMQVREKNHIPIVVSMGASTASGGYWVSLAADEIVAHPTTLTGSIGVFTYFFTAENFANRWGINEDMIQVPDQYVHSSSLFQKPSELMIASIQASIDHIYDEFLQRVVTAKRASDVSKANEIAQGRVYSGIQAFELGLVDHLGNLQLAIDRAAELSSIGSEFNVIEYSDNATFLDRFKASLFESSYLPILEEKLQRLGLSVNLILSPRPEIYAIETIRIQ